MHNAGFEVLTAVIIKGSTSLDITPFSPLKCNRLHGVISQKQELFKQMHVCISQTGKTSFVKQNRVKLSAPVIEILNFIWHDQEAETWFKITPMRPGLEGRKK
jgi:hypothetical protein